MHILITGITGRIGGNLASLLLKQGHTVRGLVWPQDPRIEKFEGLNLDLHEGNLTNLKDVQSVMEGVDAVYHLGAAFQGGGPFTGADYFDINVKGTFHMLKAAVDHGKLKHFLFASTDAVYAKYPPEGMTDPIDQDTLPRRPSGWYAMSKSIGEELCNGYHRTYDLPITILRFCLVVGAGEILDFRQFYLSKLKTRPELKTLWAGEERLLLLKDANGRVYKQHIADVRDIVHGCACALDKPAAIGQTFQLAGPRPFTWDEAVPYLSQRLDIPFQEAILQGPPTFYEYDLTKSRERIGFEPQYDIIRIIEDALAYRSGTDIDVLPTQ
ncbi:MAG: NAD(P)-dependent oxidoreductase [bacterium]|nr:NAD(P)-dependent oxidoreductase [bacterium]